MKKLIPLLCLPLVCGHALSEDAGNDQVANKDQVDPTGLTIVVMDETAKVLDTVKVADDKKSYEVTFKTSDATRKIKVVALGNRTDASVPKDVFITGKSKADLGGNGKVVVTIDEGKVISIEGDGFGSFVLTDEIKKGVLSDLKEGKQADLTRIQELLEDAGSPDEE